MMIIKEIEFSTRLAFDLWITSKKDSIVVLDQSDIVNTFGYEASSRLTLPTIKVKYIELED